ncbi:hypothetical protein PGT21_024558 [Puccinia graminis f. sp. tritici]|uniref:Uncharacterized protein n=1 Tax=Puccinia graminis f. sp. tritici TaxID=56615 RepID=A0A5B0MS50_PUCGR|nr:hypothetical protein PGT21_024558 [Puccinia graminis f. sp. tritici]
MAPLARLQCACQRRASLAVLEAPSGAHFSKSGAVNPSGKTGHRLHNCWKKFPEKAPKTESAHLTVVDEYNQLREVTNWCTLPDGTRFNADDISFDSLRGILFNPG